METPGLQVQCAHAAKGLKGPVHFCSNVSLNAHFIHLNSAEYQTDSTSLMFAWEMQCGV